MESLIIKNSQLVTATFTGTPTVGRNYKFDDIPNLSRNNIVLYGIEAFTAAQLAKTSLGQTVIADADKVNLIVTLKDTNNVEFVYQIPYSDLIRSANGGFVAMLEPKIINLTECYVQLVAAGTVAASQVALFNFYYDLIQD